MAVVENDTPKILTVWKYLYESIFINSKFLLYITTLKFRGSFGICTLDFATQMFAFSHIFNDFATFIFAILFDSSHYATFNFAISPQIRHINLWP